jgi:hypothetical protein
MPTPFSTPVVERGDDAGKHHFCRRAQWLAVSKETVTKRRVAAFQG